MRTQLGFPSTFTGTGALQTALIVVAGLVLIPAAHCVAQNTNVVAGDSRDDLIRQMQMQLQRLESEVKELRAKSANSVSREPPQVSGIATTAEVPDSAVNFGGEDPDVRNRYPSLQFHGFGDVNFIVTDRSGDHNTFAIGQMDFFVTSRLAEDLNVLTEVVAETTPDNEVKFEVERLLLQYRPREYFNVAAGRYHTAIGYYSTTYHHGSWFQTTVSRPFIFDFEDDEGVLPLHNVGLSFNGAIPSGSLGLQYVFEVGNGRKYGSDGKEPVLNVADDNSFKALNFGLSARPDILPGLQLGVSWYFDRLTPDNQPRINQSIVAAYVVYQRPKFEFLNELLWIRHDPQTAGDTTESWAAYTQLSQQFGRFRPYVRYQYMYAPEEDPIFANFGVTGLTHGPSIGLRYDFSDFATIKVQADHYWRGNERSFKQFTTQVGFTF